MNKDKLLMSPTESKIYEFFNRQFTVIKSDCLRDFISFEQFHADMQALNIRGKLFVNSNCEDLISTLKALDIAFIECENIDNKYPQNVALNSALVGNKLFCNEKSLHPKVKEYCNSIGITIINVKQGYTKCSTLIIGDNALITDDTGIFSVAIKHNVEALLIEKGDVYLNENTIGFIGGASCLIGETVFFFGDINTHRNSNAIKEFIYKRKLNIICITDDKLTDIGGIIKLN